MICPVCRVEYRKGFYTCADCGAELVEEIPGEDGGPKAGLDLDGYAPLLYVGGRGRYEILRAHLEAAGIEYAPGPAVVDRLRFPIPLLVRAERMEIARNLLEDLDSLAGGENTNDRAYPGPAEAAAAVGVAVEAAVLRDGRYLVIEAGDGAPALPGGQVAPDDEAGGTLEEAVRRILSEQYWIEAGEEMVYAGSGFRRIPGGLSAVLLFLVRWRLGGGVEGRWLPAAEIEGLPGAPVGLIAGISRAEKARLDRGW